MAGKPVQVLQTAAFARAYKKLQKNQKADVDDAVDAILNAPEQGRPSAAIFWVFTSTNSEATTS
jgi:hypothetical protein